MEPSRTLRISKTFLDSIVISMFLTICTGIILLKTFNPLRYTGKAAEIYGELITPIEWPTPSDDPPRSPDSLTEEYLIYLKKHPEKEAEEQIGIERRKKMLGNVPLVPAATTPVYIDREEFENKTGKILIFGGTEEFFQYCHDAGGAVTWNREDIEGSIRSREDYLLARMGKILLFVLPIGFIISYLILYSWKNKIKIIIN
jgi:hypothetical protein